MLNAEYKQFTIQGDGRVHYQPLPGNPLPGEAVAVLRKGESALSPAVEVLGEKSSDPAVQEKLDQVVQAHLRDTLAPLFALQDDPVFTPPSPKVEEGKAESTEGGDDAAQEDKKPFVVPAVKPLTRQIAQRLFESMGTMPRADIDDLLQNLDQDDRRVLRRWQIRLGPILVFQPDLNKPAAVKLRGLFLWAVFHGMDLPAPVPADGLVSTVVDGGAVDPAFYRSIGYPVYGPRAIRIDMLDRVISAVYDAADKGQFQATHQMAEWLGCSIEDLYKILESMGHSKKHDPEEEAAKIEGEDSAAEQNTEQGKAINQKPELATFRLKKGKAFAKGGKPHRAGKRDDGGKKKPGKRNKKTNKQVKKREFGPKPSLEDSPFAVLKQLKDQG